MIDIARTLQPDNILRMVEGFGLTGTWSWTFAGDEHVWSPGLFRILGLEPGTARAEYGLMLALVHPEDRDNVTSTADLLQTGQMTQQTFRVIRPDGTLRTVMSRGEVILAPDGRPIQAMGVLIDVSDREMLARAQAAERRRRRTVFEQTGSFTSITPVYPYTDFSPEWLELVGKSKQALLDEPTLPVLKEERTRWRDHGRELYLTRQVVNVQPRLILASGETVPYRMVMVPIRSGDGGIEGWMNYVAPLHFGGAVPGALRDSLEHFIQGPHLRAARALLGWSMQQLAAAAKLSFSTIRRLEEEDVNVSGRARQCAVAALREHGVVFSFMDDGTLSVGKRSSAQ
ncbi:MAG TPA: PAS domain-containing protein [Methylobacterium sp.]|jgi:PAS domain S-box-containing protein|uniref:PAS domain-containing protein n=1 Tax=Methylorubrum sp. B1-46 TaxID=2897334 RepID=UPI001E4E0C09|nr:PAS domain-containing protein [Methylorubrum sp. B1-46]UGB26485.1 PAS domain-containing protein [Methylorubrum sp. B1-46]HEV2545306.1 PAS domain-containing protein [Methylobacterium sp.]